MNNNLINKYKENYNISKDIEVKYDNIIRHFELEKNLTIKLLNSRKRNRLEVFRECYTELYNELNWLNLIVDTGSDRTFNIEDRFEYVYDNLEKSSKEILEIGPGNCELIDDLAEKGYNCFGSEITVERGKKLSKSKINWVETDGIHLSDYLKEESFDIIISNDVIEHLHPEDIITHFLEARKILKNGGKYIFSTPINMFGPNDISRVFGYKKPVGMHLKEYKMYEIHKILKKSNFSIIKFPRNIYNPGIRNILNIFNFDELKVFCFIERILYLFPYSIRHFFVKVKRLYTIRKIILIAYK